MAQFYSEDYGTSELILEFLNMIVKVSNLNTFVWYWNAKPDIL
jgi:hypothetical protein